MKNFKKVPTQAKIDRLNFYKNVDQLENKNALIKQFECRHKLNYLDKLISSKMGVKCCKCGLK